MKDNSMKSRLVKRLALLALLLAGLAYLKNPTPAHAGTCIQNCQATEQACVRACHGNPTCSNECVIELKLCIDSCPK